MKFNLRIFLLGLVSFGVLFWLSVSSVAPKIEASLTKQAEAYSLEFGEISEDLQFEFNGRDCSISGTIYKESDREKIVNSIESIKGIRDVSDELKILKLALPQLRIEKSGDPNNLIWKIKGVISDKPNAKKLQDTIAKTLGNNNQRSLSIELKKDSRTANTLSAEKINTMLSKTLEILPEVSVVELSDNNFGLTAQTYSKERRDKIIEFARSHMGDKINEIIDRIEILEPTEDPTLSFASEDEGLLVSGLLADATLKNKILELIKQTNQQLKLRDEIKVGDNVKSAEWSSSIIRIVPALIAEVQNLELKVSSDVVEFSGTVIGEDKKNSIQTLAAQSFEGKKSSFKLVNELVVFVPPEKANLTMSLDKNGELKLAGLLPQKDLYETFMKDNDLIDPDNDEVNDEILVKQNVENAPWVNAMSKLVKPFLGSVQWGALSVHGDEVALEAEVSDPESGDVLQALVKNAFPLETYKRVIQITVAEPAGPTDEDIMALEQAATDTVIYFLSESHSLGSKDKEKLDELAELFLKVPGSSLALLGHTDPYGNADYNRKLSKKRCDSVKRYLVERGINSLLLEVEEKGETEKVVKGRTYKSGRRVEFELR